MSDLVFITGAGFGADAAEAVRGRETAYYPLLGNVLHECFDLGELPEGKSIEDLFQEAIENQNREPFEKLIWLVSKADYDLTPHLAVGGSCENNPYNQFFSEFPNSHLLTYNYDSSAPEFTWTLR